MPAIMAAKGFQTLQRFVAKVVSGLAGCVVAQACGLGPCRQASDLAIPDCVVEIRKPERLSKQPQAGRLAPLLLCLSKCSPRDDSPAPIGVSFTSVRGEFLNRHASVRRFWIRRAPADCSAGLNPAAGAYWPAGFESIAYGVLTVTSRWSVTER